MELGIKTAKEKKQFHEALDSTMKKVAEDPNY